MGDFQRQRKAESKETSEMTQKTTKQDGYFNVETDQIHHITKCI